MRRKKNIIGGSETGNSGSGVFEVTIVIPDLQQVVSSTFKDKRSADEALDLVKKSLNLIGGAGSNVMCWVHELELPM